jgi:hypothetical protein
MQLIHKFQTPIYDIPEDKSKKHSPNPEDFRRLQQLLKNLHAEETPEEAPENEIIMIDVPKS